MEKTISFLRPVGPAFGRMKQFLFKPFDAGLWFTVGFCAWLASLGGNGFSFNTHFNVGDQKKISPVVVDFVKQHLVPLVIAGIVGLLLVIILGFVFEWLIARGRFMFLSNVVTRQAAVSEPWTKYRREGNSLFVWTIVFDTLTLLAILVVLAFPVVFAIPTITKGTCSLGSFAGLLIAVPIVLGILVVAGYVHLYLLDFIVPLMFRNGLRTGEAWHLFGSLFRARAGSFLAYGLFRLLMFVVYGLTILTFGLMTCCCGFVVLMVPYFNAVVKLPISVFDRYYSLEYLRQFGPEFDLLTTEPPVLSEPTATTDGPVSVEPEGG